MKHKRRRTSGVRRVGRTLYRALVTVSALIVVLFCAYNALVRAPEQAAPPMAAVPQPTSGTSGVEEEEAEPTPTPTPLVRKEGFYTFLLVATDEGGGNTDTLMVAAYDTAAQTVGVVSIPRDTLVDRTPPKINGVYAREGMEGLRETVSDLIGIPIDYTVMVNLNGFQRLVNAVGGVDFYVPCDMDYDDPTADPPLSIHYTEGMTHLDGQEAMEVVRFRHNNDGTGYTDVGRSQTQQKLLVAVGKKVLANPGKISEYVDIFLENVKTDLSAADILWLAGQAAGLDTENGISTATLPGDGSVRYNGTSWCYQLEREECLAIFNDLLNPYTTEITMDMTNMFQAT
ncbi:MAG TPA: LCP family protein [Candidatus Intestinimonas stercorigallinarum]|nr:LCP family protein [Candidatus Intestinimonas stercorigallinarum]